MNRLINQTKQLVRASGSIIYLAWKADAFLTIVFILLLILASILPGLSALVVKYVVDQISYSIIDTNQAQEDGTTYRHIFWGGIFIFSQVAYFVINPASEAIRTTLCDRLQRKVDQMIMETSASLPGLFYFETPKFYDLLQYLQRHTFLPEVMLWLISASIRNFVTLIFILFLLFKIDWVIPLVLVIVSVPHLIVQFRHYKKSYDVMWSNVPESRKLDYYFQIMVDPKTIKEIKTLNIGKYFINRYSTGFDKIIKAVKAVKTDHAHLTSKFALLSGIGLASMYVYVTYLVTRGDITPGDIALYFSSVTTVQETLWMFTLMSGRLSEVAFQYRDFMKFLNLKPILTKATQEIHEHQKSLSTIEFRNVHFSYPESATEILRGVSFTINAGETVALIGDNGAGKSTIVKLLCRFYDPTSGCILTNGVDLRQCEVDPWRNNISAIFQDFSRFSLTVRENIGIGKVENVDDLALIEEAAEKGMATPLIAKLANGYSTLLGRQFAGGVDLSEGEWQKVAMARAFIRSDAGLLILDEPTSALDAEAEYSMYLRFKELTQGKITLLISHRLSTVKMADRIIVLDKGSIAEDGSHEELMAADGKYASMFKMQADRYK